MTILSARKHYIRRIKDITQRLASRVGAGLTTASNLDGLRILAKAGQDLEFLQGLSDDQIAPALRNLPFSTAQLRQDLFVLSELNFKREGYFVEFGATDGKSLSNTFLLEKKFGWTGIVAEPATIWHRELLINRTCIIDNRCVWSDSTSQLQFNEVSTPELSTVDSFSGVDHHLESRRSGKYYLVQTVSLADLLREHDAPKRIDYLSIDTEGSEYEILRNFAFDEFKFSVISCEHNFTPVRERIHQLLVAKGYRRKFSEISKFDDWYILTN